MGACALLLAAVAAPASAAAAPPAVDAATSGAHSELRKTVPITRKRGAAPRMVLSIGPGKLSGLRAPGPPGAALRGPDHRGLRQALGSLHRPALPTSIRISASRSSSPVARSIGAPSRVLARPQPDLPPATAQSPAPLPGRLRPHRPRRPSPAMPAGPLLRQPRGLRLEPARAVATSASSSAPTSRAGGSSRTRACSARSRSLPAAGPSACGPAACAAARSGCGPRRKAVLSQKVEGLERGDVLAVTAALRSDVRHLGYNALVGRPAGRRPRPARHAAEPARARDRSGWTARSARSTAPTARRCNRRVAPARRAP